MKIAIASGNLHKINEIKAIFENLPIEFISISDLGINDFEVEENGDTLEENALIKAKALYEKVKIPTISDDTGLFVRSLGLKPGVKSHRYASESGDEELNRLKLLEELKGKEDRSCYFETVICLIDEDSVSYHKGVCEGVITKRYYGEHSFGYDKIFMPEGYNQTFAQMQGEKKNSLSSRSKALSNLRVFLEKHYDICDNK